VQWVHFLHENNENKKALLSQSCPRDAQLPTIRTWFEATIIDFPNLGLTYNGGWCSATKTR